MSLSNAILNSSNKFLVKSFEDVIKNQLTEKRWINPRNYYLKHTRDRVNAITANAQIKKKPIGEYIASSTILHCYDGWNYLARASESLINGDISSAVHFIYYSELRSVMSLMAFEGIGIFDRKHVWFDSNSAASFFNKSTHSAADECIKEWSNLSSKKEVLFSLIKVKNNKLAEWIDATQFPSRSKYTSLIAKEWLDKWSIDLRLTSDQILRNEMSYRPHFDLKELKTKDSVANFIKIWKGLEPTGQNRFYELDNHLFRVAIEKVYTNWKGKSAKGPDYEKFIEKMFDKIGETKSQGLYGFLLRKSDPDDHFILIEAKKDFRNNRVNLVNPFPMFCRAILMLRLATGATDQLINNSSVLTEDLRYWWEGICKSIGILDDTSSGNDASELYNDIGQAISEIEGSGTAGWNSLKAVLPTHSENLNIMKQFQRVCFWGIGL